MESVFAEVGLEVSVGEVREGKDEAEAAAGAEDAVEFGEDKLGVVGVFEGVGGEDVVESRARKYRKVVHVLAMESNGWIEDVCVSEFDWA